MDCCINPNPSRAIRPITIKYHEGGSSIGGPILGERPEIAAYILASNWFIAASDWNDLTSIYMLLAQWEKVRYQ